MNTAEIENAWAAEVERRIAEVEEDTVLLIPAAEVIASARAALKSKYPTHQSCQST